MPWEKHAKKYTFCALKQAKFVAASYAATVAKSALACYPFLPPKAVMTWGI